MLSTRLHRPGRLPRIFGLGAALVLVGSALTVAPPPARADDSDHLQAYGLADQGQPTAGVAYTFEVNALTPDGSGVDSCFDDTVHLSYTDSKTAMPADYGYTAALLYFWCVGDDGQHEFTIVPVAAGQQTLTVSDLDDSSVSNAVLTFDVAPGPAASLAVSSLPASMTQGAEAPIRVTLRDAWGNVATNYTGTVHFASSDGSAALPADYAFGAGDAGTHLFAVSFGSTGSQSVTVTDTLEPSSLHASASTTVATADHFYVEVGEQEAGVYTSCSVTAEKSTGATDTGYTGTVKFSSSDTSATLPSDASDVAGQVTFTGPSWSCGGFDLMFYKAGTQTLTATDESNSDITGTGTVTVLGGDTVGVKIVGLPSATVVGPVSITVKATDAWNNWGSDGPCSFSSSDPKAVLPADFAFHTSDYGTRQFTVTLETPGTQTLKVSCSEDAKNFSATASTTVVYGTATHFAVSGLSSPQTAGVAGTITVKALDAYGNTAPTYDGTVHFTSSDSKAVLPANYTFNSTDKGVHASSVTLKTAGTQSVTATDTVTASIKGSQTGIVVSTTGSVASTYHATSPARVLDSRPTGSGHTNIGLAGKFTAGTVRTFAVAGVIGVGATSAAVPTNATAVTGNLTIVNETAAGVVALGPTMTASGATTTINFVKGDIRANNVTMGLGAGGKLSAVYRSATAGATIDLIFDVTGFFTPDTSGATYHVLDPGPDPRYQTDRLGSHQHRASG